MGFSFNGTKVIPYLPTPGPCGVTVIMVEQGDMFGVADWALHTDTLFKGQLSKPPNVFIHLPVALITTSEGANQAVQQVNACLNFIPGKKLVVAVSAGAALLYKWIRTYTATTTIPYADLRFLSVANPERLYGGWEIVPNPPIPALFSVNYGGPGIPAGTPWKVTDYSQRWDPISDNPTSATPSAEAYQNAWAGINSIHNDYFHVGLDDPEVKTRVEGNITYALRETEMTPLVQGMWWLSAAQKLDQEAITRPLVEASFSRPVYS